MDPGSLTASRRTEQEKVHPRFIFTLHVNITIKIVSYGFLYAF